ncbi:Branched-chain amino acid transport system permease protein LivM (TC 3.A.1.4.1), partial [hydrothermal vent metagenome]
WVNLFVGITNILRNPDLSFSQVIGQIATVVATLQVGFWIAAAITVTATVAVGFLGSIFLIVISSVILNWLSTKIIDLLFSNKYLFMEEMTL